MGRRDALDVALEIFRRPALARAIRRGPLPEGMITVIRIAAGDDLEEGIVSPELARSLEEARAASTFFLQQILLDRQSDSYRLLGLRPGARSDQVREHKRWLLKWLHPDRNHNKWESALFQRVVKAAEELENRSAGTAHAPSIAGRDSQRARRGPRRRLKRFAARREREPADWREAIGKYSRRFAVSAAVVLSVAVAWAGLSGKPLSSAFVSLASWPPSWLGW